MKLTCDICGGDLQMAAGGQGATCTVCGVTYDIGRLREKLGAPAPQPTAQTPIQQVPQQAPVVQAPPQPQPTAVTPASDTIHYLHIKRIFSMHISKIVAVIDGTEAYNIKSFGKVSSIPLTPGEHTIVVAIADQKITELEPYNFTVTDCDWAAEVGLHRSAFSAKYELRIWEMRE